MSEEENVYQFIDARTSADPIHVYNSDLKNVPIVIDNGGFCVNV